MLEAKPYQRGAELSYKTTTGIPADVQIRPLRDVIIVEPIDGLISPIIKLVEERKPIQGIVRAAGPGCYPKRYDHPEKGKRRKMWDSKALRPCDVKVGDTVEFEPRPFQTLYWGDKLMLIMREEDLCGIRERAA